MLGEVEANGEEEPVENESVVYDDSLTWRDDANAPGANAPGANAPAVYTRSKARSKNYNDIGSSSSTKKGMEVMAAVQDEEQEEEKDYQSSSSEKSDNQREDYLQLQDTYRG
jgi:hypothetical protein